jgi:predicted ATPase
MKSLETPMIERIHIENYKCLRDVTVELGDFTILIGPNDSGKSSFLDVIQTLGKIVRQPYHQIFAGDRSLANLVWRKDPRRDVVWEVTGEAEGHRFTYHLELPVGQRPPGESLELDGKRIFWTEKVAEAHLAQRFGLGVGTVALTILDGEAKQLRAPQLGMPYLFQMVSRGQSVYQPIAEALTSSVEYRFDLGKLHATSIPKPEVKLEPSGENLAAVLDVLQNSADRSAFEAIEGSLHEAIQTLRGIVLPPASQGSGAKALEYILAGNGQPPVTIPGSLASGGALLLTAFLTLAYTQTPGLLLFEEPENGLHPFRLQMVLDILRKMSRGQIGNRKRQIILTTHNPLLLNYATPDEVRVFVRHPEEGTHVIPMTKVPDIDRLLKEFALGELWYLLGEEKLIQGQPA